MKKYRLVTTLLAAFLFLQGNSVWEGAAAVSSADFPDTGLYVATNSFPRNTVVDLTNLETGKTVRVIVASGLDAPGLLAVVSREAAEEVGLRSRTIGRIRMSAPSDPIAFSRFSDEYRSGDPDYDPLAALEGIYGKDILKYDTSGIPSDALDGPYRSDPDGIWTDTPVENIPVVTEPDPGPEIIPEPEPVPEPEPEPVFVPDPEPEPEPIPEPEPEPVFVPDPEPEPEPVPEPEPEPVFVPDPEPVFVPEPDPEPEPVFVPDPEPVFVPEPDPEPIPEPEPDPVFVPDPEPVFVPEPEPVLTDLPVDYIPPSLPPPDIPAGPKSDTTPPEIVYTLIPAEERPPQGYTPPAPAVHAVPQIFSVPAVAELERGKYYLQIGAYSQVPAVEQEISKVDRGHPLTVQCIGTKEKPIYRILIGPMNQGECTALLRNFLAKGYKDAFVRRGE